MFNPAPALRGAFDVVLEHTCMSALPPALRSSYRRGIDLLLRPGGRLIGVVGDEPMMYATVMTRTGESTWTTVQPWDTVVPRLLNFPEPSHFHF